MEISDKLVFGIFFILYQSVVRVASAGCSVRPTNTSTSFSPCHNGAKCLETLDESGLSYLCLCDYGWHGNECDVWLKQSETCGGSFSAETGLLTSPNYPNNYTLRVECIYVIKIPNAKAIKLDFLDFSTENGRDTFEYGTGPIVDYDIQLGMYTGSVMPQPIILYSNTVWLWFSSDRSISDKGWKLEYTADFDDCASDYPSLPVCSNGGTCTDGFQGFYCQCTEGFTDNRCQTEILPEIGTTMEDMVMDVTSVDPQFEAMEGEIDLLKRVIVGLSLLSALVIGFLITALVLKRSHTSNTGRFLPDLPRSPVDRTSLRRGNSKLRRGGPYVVPRRPRTSGSDRRVIVEITPSQRRSDRPAEPIGQENKIFVTADEV